MKKKDFDKMIERKLTFEKQEIELSVYKLEKKIFMIMGIAWALLLLGLWIYPYRYEILYRLNLKEEPELIFYNYTLNSSLFDMPKTITIDYGYFPLERIEINNFQNCTWIPCPCQDLNSSVYCLAYCVDCGENQSKR